jgi:hypothetical protein
VGSQASFVISAYTDATPIQSWEIAFSVDSSKLEIIDVSGHSGFDDATLAMEPLFDASGGRASRIADFQHGTANQAGEIRIATVRVRGLSPGDSPLQIELEGLVDSAGRRIDTRVLTANLTVLP